MGLDPSPWQGGGIRIDGKKIMIKIKIMMQAIPQRWLDYDNDLLRDSNVES